MMCATKSAYISLNTSFFEGGPSVTGAAPMAVVFISVDMEQSHWYLAIINAKKREIQVIDSLGLVHRDELIYAVQGAAETD